ncbi:MAG TPA: cysteine methyltransferase [Synergistaceae bacterium]|jgi:methylated-DNA-[protein]-cysteine S-methyltransferase|nr:cysteine methyltransferase [Synergistaceae bacterium]
MLFKRETAIGPIAIGEKDGFIAYLHLPGETARLRNFGATDEEPPVVREAFRQLELYLDGALKKFDLPLKPEGTPFMRKVWDALLTVPYGVTASYKDIAEAVGSPKAVRAVGLANARNPIAIFIPCHRIIGSSGKLVGFGGGLELKQRLIDLEARHSR